MGKTWLGLKPQTQCSSWSRTGVTLFADWKGSLSHLAVGRGEVHSNKQKQSQPPGALISEIFNAAISQDALKIAFLRMYVADAVFLEPKVTEKLWSTLGKMSIAFPSCNTQTWTLMDFSRKLISQQDFFHPAVVTEEMGSWEIIFFLALSKKIKKEEIIWEPFFSKPLYLWTTASTIMSYAF